VAAAILPLCLVASRKVQGADQQRPPGSCEPLEAIVPHDAVVCEALGGIRGTLDFLRNAGAAGEELDSGAASAVQAACIALDNFRKRLLPTQCSPLQSLWSYHLSLPPLVSSDRIAGFTRDGLAFLPASQLHVLFALLRQAGSGLTKAMAVSLQHTIVGHACTSASRPPECGWKPGTVVGHIAHPPVPLQPNRVLEGYSVPKASTKQATTCRDSGPRTCRI
jgi:hypothetical protein